VRRTIEVSSAPEYLVCARRQQELTKQRMKLERGLASIREQAPAMERLEEVAGALVAGQRRGHRRLDVVQESRSQQQSWMSGEDPLNISVAK